jgi:hypothetical protein
VIHSLRVTFGANYLTNMVTSVPPYETVSLIKNNILHQSKTYKYHFKFLRYVTLVMLVDYVSLIFSPRDNRGQNNEQSECLLRAQLFIPTVPVEDDNTLQYNTNMLNVNQDGLTGNKVNLKFIQ